ncbi:sulfite exporter TauE/SafE family protein [Streptomyces sp. NPDC020141]|uniref:sulfite exporter TauE/SafE family protein n=1 Tax=Streptomyces sp. NPDC020141 TaxID=3365065 RepID=UPI003789EB47
MSVLVLALAAGAVVGLALGGLGGGGSVLAVPALIYLLGFSPVAATTAALIIVAATSLTSLLSHARDGSVRWRAGLLFAAAGIGPAMLGGLAAGRVPASVLTVAFSVIAALAAWRMLRPGRPEAEARTPGVEAAAGRETPDPAASDPAAPGPSADALRVPGPVQEPPAQGPPVQEPASQGPRVQEPPVQEPSGPRGPSASPRPSTPRAPSTPRRSRADRPVRPARAAGAGAGLGALTGVLGVGGGFLAVPALTGVLGLRMRAAVGTSLLIILVNSLAALTARTGTADGLDWAVIAPFTGAAILGAWDGRRLAAKLSGDRLRRLFAYVLAAVAALMLLDSLIGLV